MTDNGNGAAPPEALLAGHLVIYPDMVAFRPDGGGDDQVVYRPIKGRIGMGGLDAFIALLSPGDGGQLGMLLGADSLNPVDMMKTMGMNRKARRAMAAEIGQSDG